MKYLITGGAGFIGSAVVRSIINQTDDEVLVYDKLTYAGNLMSLAQVSSNQRFKFVHADICNRREFDCVMKEFCPDTVMHLAAESHVDRSIDGPAEFIQTNIIGTFTIIESVLAYWRQLPHNNAKQFRYVHISTDEVFGSLGQVGLFREDTPYAPTSPYSASKAASDHLVRSWAHTYGLPAIVTNCSNNYGPYHFPEKLIPLTIINAIEGRPLPIYGRGENVRDWLYVEDHASALLLVAKNGEVGQSYNVGGNNERRNVEVVEFICDYLNEIAPNPGGYRHLINFVQDRPGHDLRYAIDSSKITLNLGWRPKESFESGLRKTVEWFASNRNWWQSVRSGKYRGERLGLSQASENK